MVVDGKEVGEVVDDVSASSSDMHLDMLPILFSS